MQVEFDPKHILELDLLTKQLRRLTAQKFLIDHIFNKNEPSGMKVLEIGLGKGFTFDYISKRIHVNDIFVIEKREEAILIYPDIKNIFWGDALEIFAELSKHYVGWFDFIHIDIGTIEYKQDFLYYKKIMPYLFEIGKKNAFILSDRPLESSMIRRIEFSNVDLWSYNLYSIK